MARWPFGYSDGDFQLLQYATEGLGRRFGMFIHHDDGAREYACDREVRLGRLARGLDEAEWRGWHLASIREDWVPVFPA